MTQSQIFLGLCLSFIGGILFESFINVPQLIWLGFLFSVLIFVLSSLFGKKLMVAGLCLLAFWAGLFRLQIASDNSFNQELNQYYDQEIVFKASIVNEPEVRADQTRLVVKSKNLASRVLVTSNLYPKYKYGDELEIKGKLKKPVRFDDFDYRGYLAKDKIYSIMYYPKIRLVAKNQGYWFYQSIYELKDRLRNNINKTLLPPESSVLRALLLGDKYALSESLKERLNKTGTRHIVAISGMHMVIWSQVLLFLGLGIGLWRKHVFYFVTGFLVIYILMIGLPSSALRAGIMTGLLLLAQKLGRLKSAGQSITFTAAVMLALNPLLLKADVGFQLSFLAVLSIVYLKPFVDRLIVKWPNPIGLRDILAMSLSAQIGVLPLLIYHFGQISLVSPLSNLLIIPLLPAIMMLGIILSLAGLFSLSLAQLIAWPVWFLLNYVVLVVDWMAGFWWASIEIL